jgi:O-antigen/teichoic acid export membrane protein
VDRLAVGRVLGVEAVAYYSVGVSLAGRLLAVVSSISQSFTPHVSEALARGDYRRISHLLFKGTWLSAGLSAAMAAVIILLSRPFLQYWLGVEFAAHSLDMFRILIAAYAVIAIGAPAYFIANGIGLPFINSIGTILGGTITIFLIFVLGRTYGLNGAAWANFGYCVNFFILIYIHWRLKHDLAKWNL